jgi:hypothetical protein
LENNIKVGVEEECLASSGYWASSGEALDFITTQTFCFQLDKY